MAFKMKYKNLEEVVKQLRSAVQAHGKQANTIEKHIDKMKDTPLNKKVPNCVPRGTGADRLSKPKNDPCWENYVQRGMKEKK